MRAAADDSLLAVIHGIDPAGWRTPEGPQGYLIKNATGPGMQARPLARQAGEVRGHVMRAHEGDVIAASRDGRRGVTVWTGGRYVWLPSSASPDGAAR